MQPKTTHTPDTAHRAVSLFARELASWLPPALTSGSATPQSNHWRG
ncbi:MAG: hypothetical protein JAY88_13945 [Candidatus Thiodiazotropha lotti]|nr:hypothetical protein [Candidatus Thiodiazotropha lotti]MCG8004542.1 hypothetical protein [Candidatus Thiodiazotropha lotti]MCW4188167.1 hypothetical protein [Candidatus Thiodiazotropha lotti]MCW4222081.1 hypothetical protein [Candidatus Thiodiazotropha lotti]